MAALTHDSSMQLIRERLESRGDMPIFSASVNRIHTVGSDPDSDAMALSVEILKDANMTAKVLRLANSPLYNRGLGKITQLSRAVVILGFDILKNATLTLKLIDSFHHEHPEIDVNAMLVNAFLAGTFVRGISAKAGVREIEQAYISGLLHNLGELVTACTLPDYYLQIQKLSAEKKLPKVEAEQLVLGTTMRNIGKEVARSWEFPLSMVNSMDEYTPGKSKRIRNRSELTGALASLANKMTGLLYAEHPDERYQMAELTLELSKVAGIPQDKVSAALEQSFKESCELAQHYGLTKQTLAPKLRHNEDEALDKLAREFSFYAKSEMSELAAAVPSTEESEGVQKNTSQEDSPRADAITTTGSGENNASPVADANALLTILFELTSLISQKANFNDILQKVLVGMHEGAGFDRAVLCLLSPDHKSYSGRMFAGQGAKDLKEYFNFPVNSGKDLFSKIILEGNELLVTDIDQGWRQQLPEDFLQSTGARSFMLGTLRSRQRPLGIFYADKAVSGRTIGAEDSRNFLQLIAQAQLALQVR